MLPGETILSGAPNTCPTCKEELEMTVCHSQAGYYVGTECNCGPYSRETGYFKLWEDAQALLNLWDAEGELGGYER